MSATANTVLRMPKELHEKIRWLSYKEKRSQNEIMLDILHKALEGIIVPEESAQ